MSFQSIKKLLLDLQSYVKSIPKEIKLLVLVGFVIRLLGIGWGLPVGDSQMYHPDEPRILNIVGSFPKSIVTNEFFDWPNFIAYFIGLLLMPFRYFLRVLVKLSTLQPETYSIIMQVAVRFIVVILGTLTILVVYEYCRKKGNKFAGVLAAVLTCFSLYHVQNSSWATTDVALSLVVMVSLLMYHNLIKNPSTANYLLAAVFTGLVISTKYPGGVILLSFLAAHIIVAMKKKKISYLFNKNIFIAVPVVIGAFLITNPHIFFHFSKAIEGISFVSGLSNVPYYYGSPNLPGFDLGNMFSAFSNLSGVIFGVVAIIALVYALIRKEKDYPLLQFFILYGLYFFSSSRIYTRNLIVLVPVAAILIAVLFSDLYRITKKSKFFKKMTSVTLAVLLASVIVVSGSEVVYRIGEDTRTTASKYIYEQIPEGATIAIRVDNEVGWFWQTVKIDEQKHTIVNTVDNPEYIVTTSLRTRTITRLLDQNINYNDPELMKVVWYPAGSNERPGEVPGVAVFETYNNLFDETGYAVHKEFRKDISIPAEQKYPVITIYKKRTN